MADNIANDESVIINGVTSDTPSSEFFDSTDFPPLKSPTTPFADVDNLHKKIATLERENEDSESRIAELKTELANLRAEKDAAVEQSESEKKAAEAIAKTAAELEGVVARLQHELGTALSDSAEANSEVQQLSVKISDLKKEKAVVEDKVKAMESKMEELIKKSRDSEALISGLMDKMAEREAEEEAAAAAVEREINGKGADAVVDGASDGADGEGLKGLLMEKLPVIGAVTVGVVIVGGVMCYVRHIRN